MKKRETNEQMERQQPCYYPREGASTIVVFIHGIVEGPDQFLGLMKRSSELGFAASSLLLPGHGGTGEGFARSSRQQWLEYVNAEIARYKKNYNSIILVGHSYLYGKSGANNRHSSYRYPFICEG